jgi:hypothetical protein
MKEARLNTAILEAERFLKKAKIAKKEIPWSDGGFIYQSRKAAACKRASLDLTMALADLRRSDYI